MNPSVSLINTLLPAQGSIEDRELNSSINLTFVRNLQQKQDVCMKVNRLMLTILKETAEALINAQYKSYDALIKNFGCQITALEASQLCKKPDLLLEAVQVANIATNKINSLPKSPPMQANEVNLRGYLANRVKGDVLISQDMARLVRLRFLNVINGNVLVKDPIENEEIEVPKTMMRPLYDKITARAHSHPAITQPIDIIVKGLQAEESLYAVSYIQIQAQRLSAAGNPRGPILTELLQQVRYSQIAKGYPQTPIASVPLTYNSEVVIRSVDGLVCVKNKLAKCGIPIAGAQPKRVIIKMPEEIALTDEEISALDPREPLLVIEGYIPNDTRLEEKINEIGLTTILGIECSRINQYASGTDQGPLNNLEANKEILALAARKDETKSVLRIDHMYCASVSEER